MNSAISNIEMAHVTGEELDKLLRRYQNVQHEFEIAGGYAWRHRLEATLLGVGLDRDSWEQNVGTLSGGQRSRLALAKLLIGQTDLLLLDEPTNHLDLAAIAWLEKYLADFNGAVLIISHDRYLLDRLANRIAWLTGAKLKTYPGNYSAFVTQRELQELSQKRAFDEQQADIEKQAEFIRRFGAGQRSKRSQGPRQAASAPAPQRRADPGCVVNKKDSRLARHRSARRRSGAEGQGA